ncbi:MAG: hypothetical protein O3B20_03685 [Bacteroidetes bacterium]|nr:hypothetical protein [Bacteroidota bacterium]MDA0828835.1 hypothetical protein [Bacteroidota bacterium]MDA1199170.1 hypothetical protein [Bacteroidota bacterium]
MYKTLSILAVAAVTFASCEPSTPEDPNPGDSKTKIISENVTANQTWYADTVYQLGGRITVTAGATLTIEPGTVIKGEAGTGANATALLIARGGKLMAEGTASMPIIFTSVADEITQDQMMTGDFKSPNLDPTVNGLWGGVIVLGNAKISASNSSGDVSEVQIEGIPTSDANGLYGGSDDADNSGVMKYISIRHGGANIGSGNEINGLTLGGVGSETTIENVEVVSNQDDGIEWFGGSVNVTNVVVWNAGDDAIDSDQSWGGTLDNFVVITPSGSSFELDGPEGAYEASHTIKNGNVQASSADITSGDLINTDANSLVSLESIYITDIMPGQIINRIDAAGVFYTDIVLNVDTVSNYIKNNGTHPGITAGTTPKANTSVFGWTWAAQAGVIQ